MRLKTSLSLIAIALIGAAPASASAADCPGADLPAGSSDTIAVRAAVVCLTNAERANAGLAALVPEGRLEAAAQGYSQVLVRDRFFSHVTPGGSELTDRLSGYSGWRRIGENLAWGEGSRGTPQAIVEAWMASPGHRKNILADHFDEIGVGVVAGTPIDSDRPGATYTAHYGARYSDSPARPVAGAEAAAAPRSTPASTSRAVSEGKTKRVQRARKSVRRCRAGKVRVRTSSRGRTVTRCVKRSSRRV